MDLCRSARRRVTLGWTGSVPDLRQGQASVRLLHEMLESLATIKPNHELSLYQLLDILPPATLREAIFVVITTRPVVLADEAQKSDRLRSAAGRGLSNRIVMLDVSKGDLAGLVEYGSDSMRYYMPTQQPSTDGPMHDDNSLAITRDKTSTEPVNS